MTTSFQPKIGPPTGFEWFMLGVALLLASLFFGDTAWFVGHVFTPRGPIIALLARWSVR